MATNKNQILVENLISMIDGRKPTEKQLAWLRRHLSAAEIERIGTIAEASARIRLLIADREPSQLETGVEEAADHEPTEAQLQLLTTLMKRLGPDAGVTPQELLTLQRDGASDLIDSMLEKAERRKADSRAAPVTEKQSAYLLRMGVDPEVVAGLSRGVASDVISRLVKRSRQRA